MEKQSSSSSDDDHETVIPPPQEEDSEVIIPNDTWLLNEHLLEELDIERWFAVVEKLESINRYALGENISESTEWLVNELEQIGGFEVEKMSFVRHGVEYTNVIATLLGSETPEDEYIIGGHYDSISEDPFHHAPGAVDNATGAAGVIEMARVFAKYKPKSTIRFILFSGEEIGLLGSKSHASWSNEFNKNIKAMLNMDMIGWNSGRPEIEIETERHFSILSDLFIQSCKRYSSHNGWRNYKPWGSDHISYIQQGFPALLTINRAAVSYAHYHTTLDNLSQVDKTVALQILRTNIVAMGVMANNHFNITPHLKKKVEEKRVIPTIKDEEIRQSKNQPKDEDDEDFMAMLLGAMSMSLEDK